MKKRSILVRLISVTAVAAVLCGGVNAAALFPAVPWSQGHWSYGDVDGTGQIEASDALLTLQAVTGKIALYPNQEEAADVDGSEGVTAADALMILQRATQKVTSFPVEEEEPYMDLTEYVDMSLGVSSNTNTVIGPQRPNASVNPSPDGTGYTANGYNGGDIRGFSQMHVSGTGVPKYGQVLLSPQVGLSTRLDGHDSPKSNEQATCSEYSVTLDRWDIDCSFTCTENATIYKFRYPQSDQASLLIDMGHNNGENNNKGHHTGLYNESSDIQVEIGTDQQGQTVAFGSGYYEGGWGQPHYIYFYAIVDKTPKETGTFDAQGAHPGENKLGPAAITSEDQRMAGLGAYMLFDTQPEEEITVKVGMSLKSVEQARQYLDSEIPAWDYNGIEETTRQLWNRELNRISIEGESLTEEQKTIFYTAMYHTMVMPRYRTGDIEEYGDAVMLDDHFAGWDTFRTVMPLHTLIRPQFTADVVNSFITRYQVNGYVRDSMTGGHDMYEQQGGDNVDVIIADAYAKLKDTDYDVDWDAAYEVVRNHAENYRLSWQGKDNAFADNVIPDKNASYKTLGYIPGDDPTERIMCCNYTLDYAYNDYCAALMAKDLGTQEEYERYLQRSGNWENLWNPALAYGDYTGFIGPRARNGDFIDIDVTRNWGSWKEYFYEANSYNYSFYVPQDPYRLIELCGGEEAFCDRLYNGIMKGQVDFGNEPAFLSAFLFAYTGSPYLTADCVEKVRSRFTLNGNGGNDDSGALSAWYIFTTMGLFPCAGQDFYYLTSPGAEKVTVHLENGEAITIQAHNLSAENKYIQSITVNGQPYYSATIPHSLIAGGADIVFEMGSRRLDYTRQVEWKGVTFETEGGTETPEQWIAKGDLIVRPEDPVRKGYRFLGWYTDSVFSKEWDFEKDTVQDNMTLYARWEESVVQDTGEVSLKTLEKVENLSRITLGGEDCEDWAFYGYKQPVKKAGGNPVFTGSVSPVSGELTEEDMKTYNGNSSPYFSWSDGTPTLVGTDVRSIIWNDTGLIIPVSLAQGKRDISLYISGVRARAYLEVQDSEGRVLLREDVWGSSTARPYYKAVLSFDCPQAEAYQIRLMVDQEDRQQANYSVSLFAATSAVVSG